MQVNFKKWNRIIVEGCLTFPVSLWWFRVLVLCSAATSDLPLDTWNTFGLQENGFGNQFSTLNSPRDHHQGIHPCAPQRERESVPQATRSGTPIARDDKQNRGIIPMPTFAGRPSTMSSSILVEFPHNLLVGQQRQQISELQFDKFPTPHSYLCWKIKIQKSNDYLFWFSIGGYVMDQRSRDGRFIWGIKILAIKY